VIAELLLFAAAPQTAIEAERAFAAAAVRDGQWTAFRRYAAPSAIMFVPQPTSAQTWLKDRKDPPHPVRWQPSLSFVSCDGGTAINTGPWQRADGSVGYFTTVWQRQADGDWKWLLDSGDTLARADAAPETPKVARADCRAKPVRRTLPLGVTGSGAAADGSLRWWYTVLPDGGRTLAADYWDGATFKPALANQIRP
jgi:hypothetical protein